MATEAAFEFLRSLAWALLKKTGKKCSCYSLVITIIFWEDTVCNTRLSKSYDVSSLARYRRYIGARR